MDHHFASNALPMAMSFKSVSVESPDIQLSQLPSAVLAALSFDTKYGGKTQKRIIRKLESSAIYSFYKQSRSAVRLYFSVTTQALPLFAVI
ncbi:MAG TPA: hypothetical protein V6C89_01590 [Drouetiella sp.]|jgi:hypothetical protein